MSVLGSQSVRASLRSVAAPLRTGRVSRLVGLRVEVEGLEAAVSDAVEIRRRDGTILPAEVVAVQGRSLACMPLGELRGVRYGDVVESLGHPLPVRVGHGLLGRVLDGLGNPIDDGAFLDDLEEVSVDADPPHPLKREMVDRQLALGVRAIDTTVPCGRGQRLGIFAGSGVGKSSLLSMIARGTTAQVCVLALIGERGREVSEFIQRDLGPEGLARSVVVVATSDQPALVRIRASFTATRIAEWFRDQGMDVVLMMDSLTRFAMAQREVGLSAGEPPATRGYPPSVFSLLPRLLERAGAAERGSITGLYTVLVEGDDMNEPIADAARSILDGHLVLSRRLATSGHFPSIEVLDSISRVESVITTREQRERVRELRRLLAAYRDTRDLIEIGAYSRGANALVDRAMDLREATDDFLRQDIAETCPLDESWARLEHLLAPPSANRGATVSPSIPGAPVIAWPGTGAVA
ncbi:MAG: type secretion system ATPase, FliI/YscN [Acidimicrobiaceae bacterium]|nr:type secretion system ATPase, FliI/YscN [Acidimicrobiaceae bacterium]